MPLSEREQQILHEIEKNLVAEDPDLAGLGEQGRRSSEPRFKIGALAVLSGIVLLFIFFVSQLWFVGLAAFGAMVTGIVLVAGGFRDRVGGGFRDLGNGKLSEFFGGLEEKLRDRYRRS